MTVKVGGLCSHSRRTGEVVISFFVAITKLLDCMPVDWLSIDLEGADTPNDGCVFLGGLTGLVGPPVVA
jgi:hypothetical protein